MTVGKLFTHTLSWLSDLGKFRDSRGRDHYDSRGRSVACSGRDDFDNRTGKMSTLNQRDIDYNKTLFFVQ